jgi:hypothetical protein
MPDARSARPQTAANRIGNPSHKLMPGSGNRTRAATSR